MYKLVKNRFLDKKSLDNILSELSKKPIDVSGQLYYNKDGSAKITLVNHVIDIETNNNSYSLIVKVAIKAQKEFDYYDRKEYSGHDSAFTIQLMDKDNNMIDLDAEQNALIKEELSNNTVI